MELVSIIMPCYNSQHFISEAIQSVINQSYVNWELIIVDDASKDQSIEIINQFKDSRIKLFSLTENKGSGFARNYATERALGKYIAFLDADDIWKANKLEIQIQFMKKKNYPVTFSFYELINEEGKHLNKKIISPTKINFNQLKYSNWIGNLTGIYDVDFFGKIPISLIKKRQDWILWLDIAKKVDYIFPVNESLAYYRIRKNSVSSNKLKLLQHNYDIYRVYHQMNPLQSFLAMIKFLVIHFFKPKFRIRNCSETK